MLRHRNVVDVEVLQSSKCNVDRGQLKTLVQKFVGTNLGVDSLPITWSGSEELKDLYPYVERIHVTAEGVMSSDSLLKVHIYKMNVQGMYLILIVII